MRARPPQGAAAHRTPAHRPDLGSHARRCSPRSRWRRRTPSWARSRGRSARRAGSARPSPPGGSSCCSQWRLAGAGRRGGTRFPPQHPPRRAASPHGAWRGGTRSPHNTLPTELPARTAPGGVAPGSPTTPSPQSCRPARRLEGWHQVPPQHPPHRAASPHGAWRGGTRLPPQHPPAELLARMHVSESRALSLGGCALATLSTPCPSLSPRGAQGWGGLGEG